MRYRATWAIVLRLCNEATLIHGWLLMGLVSTLHVNLAFHCYKECICLEVLQFTSENGEIQCMWAFLLCYDL